MNEKSVVVNVFGLNFNVANCLGGTLVAIVVFFLAWYLGRNVSLKPNKKQNLLEYLIDFTNGIVKDNVADVDAQKHPFPYALTLSMLIFFMNQLGLFFEFSINDHILVESLTANPLAAMTVVMMTLSLSYNFGVQKFGAKGYFANHAKPVGFLFPINTIEGSVNFLMLSLCLYGNTYTSEVLLTLINGCSAKSAGWFTVTAPIPLTLIQQGSSVFIGSTQACVFVTLSMVYTGKKVIEE